MDLDEEEDKDEDDGKDPCRIGQEEMVNTSADDLDSRVDSQSIVIAERGQQLREHTTLPRSLAPAPLPQTPETHP